MLTMEGYCWLCQQRLKLPQQGICSFCLKTLPTYPRSCPRCGLPIEYEGFDCGACLVTPPAWDQLITVTPYCFPLRRLIHQYKFKPQPQLAIPLARLFLLHWLNGYRSLSWHKPDLLIIIPLHKKRRWQRGFDQVDEIGWRLAKWLKIAYSNKSLIRTRDTLTQVTLKRTQRQRNIRDAFSLEGTVQGRNVALLDDIITTGATMNTAAQLLICAGALSVQAWSICRTL
nr:DNA utilization protein GntX [uncultured Moellerella sp.]